MFNSIAPRDGYLPLRIGRRASIRALTWMGPENVDAALETLKRTLSATNFGDLVSAAPQLPTWLAQAIGKATYA